MKKLLLTALLIAIAGTAAAQPIMTTCYELNMGMVPVGSQVDLMGGTVVVTAVRYNGFACTDLAAGPYTAVWVYTGGAPTVVEGDVIEILGGEYKEYYDLSEIDMGTFGGMVMTLGTAPVPSLPMTLAELNADLEAWESHVITITEELIVTELLSYGEWNAENIDGTVLLHDDYFFDETVLTVGDCYPNVTGMLTYNFGAFKMEPLVDGLLPGDCVVGNEAMSFGAVKSLFR